MVLRKPGPLTVEEVIYILLAKYAIIFLHSQNVEMIAFLVIDLKARLPLVSPNHKYTFVCLNVVSIKKKKLLVTG